MHLCNYKLKKITETFQLGFLHRALVLNIHLFRWGIISSNKCSFCGLEKETYLHFFWECEITQKIWNDVNTLIRNTFKTTNICIGLRDVITGCVTESSNSAIDFLCLVTKQFLYRQRCLKCDNPRFVDLKMEFLTLKNIEKYIAVKHNHIAKYNRKWLVNSINNSDTFNSDNEITL